MIGKLFFAATLVGAKFEPEAILAQASCDGVGWKALHQLTLSYPSEPSFADKYEARRVLDNYCALLPCRKCSRHFKRMMRDTPPDLSSREAFVQWGCERHNEVSRMLGKPEMPCSLEYIALLFK